MPVIDDKNIIEKVAKEEENDRLDRWLARRLAGANFSFISMMLRKKRILLNNNKAEGKSRLKVGDLVSYPQSIIMEKEKVEEKRNEGNARKKREIINLLEEAKIFENQEIIVFNKPAGIAVQGGSNIEYSVDDYLRSVDSEYRIVHRLDKETSGLLIIAKNLAVAQSIAQAFKERNVSKKYLAIIYGTLRKQKGVVNLALMKGKGAGAMEKMLPAASSNPNALEAISSYKVLADNADKSRDIRPDRPRHYLVLLEPYTGRKHQLRAHMAYLQAPILGDDKYGAATGDGNIWSGKRNSNRAQSSDNLFLHAFEITFFLNKQYNFRAPLPKYFETKLKELGMWQNLVTLLED